jgi:hypothetical protein
VPGLSYGLPLASCWPWSLYRVALVRNALLDEIIAGLTC